MRQHHPTTREQLIDAGIRLFREGRATILRSLTASTVTAEAGYHRQTFYRHWDTQCDYVGDLMEAVFAISDEPSERRTMVEPQTTTFEERVRQHASAEIDRLWDDPKGAVRIGLLAMGQLGDGRPRELAETFYQDSVDQIEGVLADILADHGRRPAALYSLEDVARAVRAQINGFVIEAAFVGDTRRARRLFDILVVQVVADLTEPALVESTGRANPL